MQKMVLAPEELKALGEYLVPLMEQNECDRTFRYTEKWIEENSQYKFSKVRKSLEQNGGLV